MCPSTFPPALRAEIHDACEAEPALLNSERIEQRFGSCSIAILPSEAGIRRSSVYSLHGQERVCRTYAVVRFSEQPTGRYTEIAGLMGLEDDCELALHVYQLLLVRDEDVFEYATIIESHHPAYLTENDLRDLYVCDAATALQPETVSDLTNLVVRAD